MMTSEKKTQPARPWYSRAAIITASAAALACLCLFLMQRNRKTASQAEVYVDGTLLEVIDLSTDREYTVEGFPGVVLKVEKGTIRFLSSDCPDQTCVRTGAISHPGQYALCLPHRILVKIPENSEDAPDAVTSFLRPMKQEEGKEAVHA